jgi:transcriptional regulator with XRE-family HTH domain
MAKETPSPHIAKVRKAMDEQGVTYATLASEGVVSAATISKFMSGGTIKDSTIDKILIRLGLKEGEPTTKAADKTNEKDRQIQNLIGKMPKGKGGGTKIGDAEYIKHNCPLCKGDGFLWIPVN